MSSKPDLAWPRCCHDDPQVTRRVIGLTSPGNVAFVERLGCCDELVTYGSRRTIDSCARSTWICPATRSCNLCCTICWALTWWRVVGGATRWEARARPATCRSARPQFFAPARSASARPIGALARGDDEGDDGQRGGGEKVQGDLAVEWIRVRTLASAWSGAAGQQGLPDRGLMVSLL